MVEIWKDVEGYEGLYQISNLGRLKSFHKSSEGRIVSVENSTGWYLSFPLTCENVQKTHRIHRLVAEHFLPRKEGQTQVNHKDLNKQNNVVSNLEWVTPTENMNHVVKTAPSFLNGMTRKNKYGHGGIIQLSSDGKFISCYANAKEAANATSVCRRNILQVARKEEYMPNKTRKQAGGYVWKLMPLISIMQ